MKVESQFKIQKEHLTWIDLVRFISMFMVVMVHSCDGFMMNYPSGSVQHFWVELYGSCLRPCVPLFVIMTGALLIPNKESYGEFCKKRLLRILYPFLIWSVLYIFFPVAVCLCGGGTEEVLAVFPYASPIDTSFQTFLINLIFIPVQFSQYAIHFWYIYLLIGLYFFIPILSAWYQQATEKAKITVLILWGISLLLPFIPVLANLASQIELGAIIVRDFSARFAPYNFGILGKCSWNEFGTLHYFSGFLGYLLLGAYLREKFTFIKTSVSIPLGIIMFTTGSIITYFGTIWMWRTPNATEAMMELFWTFNSPQVAIQTIGLLFILWKIKITSPLLQKSLYNFSVYSFGIFCIHYFIIGGLQAVTANISIYPWLRLPLASLIALLISWAIIFILSRIIPKKFICG